MELVDQPINITPFIILPQLASLVEQLITPFLSEQNFNNIAYQVKEVIGNVNNNYQLAQPQGGGIPP